jgi:AcrR family transcriptional regulator
MARDRGAQRERILEVGQRHFERFGYRRAVIDEIVREVGIAKGTFYLHFTSKEALFFELVNRLREEAMAKFYAAMQDQPTATAKLRTMIRMSLEAFDDYPLLARLVADDPEFRLVARLLEQPDVQEEVGHSVRYVQDILSEGIAAGELRADLDLETVPFVIGTLKFLHYYIGLVASHGITRKQYIEGIIDVAMNGVVRHDRAGGSNLAAGEQHDPAR